MCILTNDISRDETDKFSSRQQEIILESIKIISREGAQALTIKNIANAIKVTERAIYRHFKSKSDIIKAIICEFRNKMAQMKKILEKESHTPLEAIVRFIQLHFEGFMREPYMTSLLFSEEMFRAEDHSQEYLKTMFSMAKKQVGGLIKKGQEQSEIRTDLEPENMAIVVLGTIRFHILQWHLNGRERDLLKEGESLINTIRKMLEK
ncbi:MAG: TetR/AcrR family transcriptional regulator [Spirochaetia bacterium]|nr:TetR/AcrR family transcriptional regulator [Spirochaetia bacterium]